MARPSRNGVAERAITTPRDIRPIKHEPTAIGRAPKDLRPSEQRKWNEIIRECPWVNKSHRQWVKGMALTAARVERITDYFNKRQEDYAKRGYDIALAYLDDNGKRHPLMTDLLAAEEGLRKGLSALGASPASQVRMMSDVGDAKVVAQVEESRQRYFQ